MPLQGGENMNKTCFVVFCFILFLGALFLSGCSNINTLSYIPENNVTTEVASLDILNTSINTYGNKLGFQHITATAADEYYDTLFFVIRIQNDSSEAYGVNPDDFVAKTNSNYILIKENPYIVMLDALGGAYVSQVNAENMPVDKQYTVNTNASAYGGNGYAVGNSYSTVNSQNNPYQELGKSIDVALANSNAAQTKAFAKDIVNHALVQPSSIAANSWNYYYLAFEKPKEYPIKLVYKGMTFSYQDWRSAASHRP